VLADLSAHSDTSNIPLSEEEENRLAWLGLGLQPLNQELARAQQVAELTDDGDIGALVAFVYPESPAEASGVQPGWIILRLHVPGYPQPVDVQVSEYTAGIQFPWEYIDQIPEDRYEGAPRPWPNASNGLTQALTEAGFGTTVTVDFVVDGVVVQKEFVVEQSPPHHESAPRFKSDELGITVRDVTYELRQYFQLSKQDPGVTISKVESGSKASVAGIRHFEMITHIGDEPVMNVADFERLIAPGGDLRFTIKRLTRTRQVPVTLQVSEQPAPDEEAAEEDVSDAIDS
jgi:S1-C subfamily serine protease